jgi:predicted enzyme related to lactoylglutathione lyase
VSTVPPGTPCWADLATPDLAEARRFYPELFGWTGRITPEPEAGGYTVFLREGRAVAGAGPPAIPDQVPIRSMYVATDDADLVAARVERAGGQVVVVPPFEVFDRGRMAVFADPASATFSVWQPMAMPGAEVFNIPGAMAWNELVTPTRRARRSSTSWSSAGTRTTSRWERSPTPAGGSARRSWRGQRRRSATTFRRTRPPTGRCTSPWSTRTRRPPAPASWVAPSWSRLGTSRPAATPASATRRAPSSTLARTGAG